MNRNGYPVVLAVLKDPVRRRRLTRRVGINAVRLGLRGRYDFHVEGSAVVASVEGVEVARVDAFDEGTVAHD